MTKRQDFDNIELMDAGQGSLAHLLRELYARYERESGKEKNRYSVPRFPLSTLTCSGLMVLSKVKNIYLEEECQK